MQYRAYGNVVRTIANEIEAPLRFQGQYFDAESGLHYNRHRYYQPETGRFLTPDPIRLAGGLNNYQYVPNPVNWVDPLGLAQCPGDCPGGATTASTQNKEISPAEQAQSWQGTGNYPGVDNYKNINLRKGTVVYGGVPGQSEYYTTASALERSGYNAEKLFSGLQVAPHPDYGYRPGVTAYEVMEDTPAAFGITRANPLLGEGGLPQLYVPDFQPTFRS